MIQKQTLPGLLKTRARETPQEVAHWTLDNEGRWVSISFYRFYQEVVDLAWTLKAQGVSKGHVVAIMAATGREWELIHHAVLSLGGIVVGIDPGEIPEQLDGLVKISGIQTLVIDRLDRLDKFCVDLKAQFKSIITFDERALESEIAEPVFINIPPSQTKELNNTLLPDVVGPEDIATIIFTSGTTGTPKGIAYRHDQIIAAIDAILHNYPQLAQLPCHLACWLPLSNLFQRIVNLCALASGAEVYFVVQPQKIIEYLPQINPHIFIAVPRFYEKLYQGFEVKLGQQPKIVVQCLRYCLTAGESNSLSGKLFRKINSRLFKSFTALFGNNIRYMVSGSAPMPAWLLKRFNAMGLLILEAYGLSENVLPIAANRLTDYRFGTVGKALKNNSIMLAEDGELLVKGVGVFNGYLTDQQHGHNLNEDGYLASGDYAEIDSQGFIRLTGRKSEVFKTSTGRKIAPVSIEAMLQNYPAVENAVIFGESRKFLVALIVVGVSPCINEVEIIAYAQELAAGFAKCVTDLPEYKRPVGVVLSFTSLSVKQQELTGNLKLRRKNILQRYGLWIDELYNALDEPQSVIHRQPLLINPKIVLLKL